MRLWETYSIVQIFPRGDYVNLEYDVFSRRPYLASTTPLSAAQTTIHDLAAAQALKGIHRLSLQWISWQNFGAVTITDDDGLFRIRGHQIREGIGDVTRARQAMTIDGVVTSVDQTTFEFEGELMIRLGYGDDDPCFRRGKFTFRYREGNSRSWRLQEQENPCVDHVDHVDIYVDRDWRPAIEKPRPPTQAELWGIGMITNEPNPSDLPGIFCFLKRKYPFMISPAADKQPSLTGPKTSGAS